VLAVAGLGDRGSEAFELTLVVEEDFAVAGEVVLFEGRGCQGGFRVEEAGELGYEGVTLKWVFVLEGVDRRGSH
jgi:hypothetical protein